MSQFGTIGTLHPCTTHPSCSQFNARDIISRIESKTTGRSLSSPFTMYSEQKHDIYQEHGMISPPFSNKENVRQNVAIDTPHNGGTATEEATRRYVEVSPGVWSYMD